MISRAAVLVAALAFVASAQPARKASAVIFGTVADTGLKPIRGADVSFAGSGVRAATDSLGRFHIVSVPQGRFLLMVRNIGFRPAVEEIDVVDGDTLRLAFTLDPTAQELATVLVRERKLSPKLQEVAERRRLGFGEFFDQAEIEAMHALHVGDVLRRAKSVRVLEGLFGATAYSAREVGPCPMAVFVDGIPLGSPNLKDLPPPGSLAAVEVYAGSATLPTWLPNGPLGTRKGCGAVLLWTRDGSS